MRIGSIISIILIILIIAVTVYVITRQTKENLSPDDREIINSIKDDIIKVYPAAEHVEFFKGDKSYTINKEKIYLCLKDKDGKYYDKNMLMYVALHELAHVLNDELDHTPKFYKLFDDLMNAAHKQGLYNPSIPPVKNYCME